MSWRALLRRARGSADFSSVMRSISVDGPAETGPFLVGVGGDDIDPLAVSGLVGVLEGVRRLLSPPLEGVLSGVERAGQVAADDPEAHIEEGSRDTFCPRPVLSLTHSAVITPARSAGELV